MPLRHGWGGDKKKREIALKRKKEDDREQKEFPMKYSESATPLDIELLEAMQKPKG